MGDRVYNNNYKSFPKRLLVKPKQKGKSFSFANSQHPAISLQGKLVLSPALHFQLGGYLEMERSFKRSSQQNKRSLSEYRRASSWVAEGEDCSWRAISGWEVREPAELFGH
jgi:hypothetical protein